MNINSIDGGKQFDFGKTSNDYCKYRDIYPKSMYQKLVMFGIGKKNQNILDLGSGTAILPMNMHFTGAHFTATDISENQILAGKKLVAEKGLDNINFKVCGAESTEFDDNMFDVVTAVQCFQYFDADKATKEIRRILKPNGLFCKIFMDWMPYADSVVAEAEAEVLKYNPSWNGNGFKKFRYSYPQWVENGFNIDTVHSYDECLPFAKEAWIGRLKSCRGIGASLSAEKVNEFENEYRQILKKYESDTLNIMHQIHIEIYKVVK